MVRKRKKRRSWVAWPRTSRPRTACPARTVILRRLRASSASRQGINIQQLFKLHVLSKRTYSNYNTVSIIFCIFFISADALTINPQVSLFVRQLSFFYVALKSFSQEERKNERWYPFFDCSLYLYILLVSYDIVFNLRQYCVLL